MKPLAILALCLPLWGQTGSITLGVDRIQPSTSMTFPDALLSGDFLPAGSLTVPTITGLPTDSEKAAHQEYRLALADFALLITQGKITVDDLEKAFAKIDAAKVKWEKEKVKK